MNRRELLKAGLIAVGGMVLPTRSLFANLAPYSDTVAEGLAEATGKSLSDITAVDLSLIKELDLPHIHIATFLDTDFVDLPNLKKLTVYSIFHAKPGLSENVFMGLGGLETLGLTYNQFTDLPESVFKPLESVRHLDLTGARFKNMPASLFELSSLDKITAKSMQLAQIERLRQHYGPIVEA